MVDVRSVQADPGDSKTPRKAAGSCRYLTSQLGLTPGWWRHVQVARLKALRPSLGGFLSTPAPARFRAGAVCVWELGMDIDLTQPMPLSRAVEMVAAVLNVAMVRLRDHAA